MDPTQLTLDADTAAQLERLAHQWHLSPAHALKRALTQAEAQPPPGIPFPSPTGDNAHTASTSPVTFATWSAE